MTNAEKYLKEGISGNDIFNLSQALGEYLTIKCRAENVFVSDINIFFALKLETTPTLTENERVILRNIAENWKYIHRKDKGKKHLFISNKAFKNNYDTYNVIDFCEYDHLFQFIKERRRIRDKRIIGGKIK